MSPPNLRERFDRARRTRRHRRTLTDVETFCMFVGYPRSGHSLIGSLLDAHENVVIAHEANILEAVDAGTTREKLYLGVWENSWMQAVRTRQETGYSYAVPGQHQGTCTQLRVIGDKKGGRSSTILAERPHLLGELRALLGEHRLRVLHVMRNPYDNISTIRTRAKEKASRPGQTLDAAIDFYFSKCESVAKLRHGLGDDFLDVRLEDLITDARGVLERCCAFLGVTPSAAYLDACAGIVYRKPNRTRRKVEWPAEAIERVRARIAEFDFLDGYSNDA
ncbi:MAG: sulfotransferase [bacterium]|nr:sulfotransferase [bacterium]